MRIGHSVRALRWIGPVIAPLVLSLPAAVVLPTVLLPNIALAAAEVDLPSASATAKDNRAVRHHKGSSLDDHVKALSKALNLDRSQESELRTLLLEQREQIKSVWDDTTVPPAQRVGATQAISDKTADRIRGLLNDEQKKRYNPPKAQPPASDSPGRSVEDWMDAIKPK